MAENDKEGETSVGKAEKVKKRGIIGFTERRRIIREERERRTKPQPWIVQKLAVGIVFAIAGYAWYVYIGRFCVPMIRKDSNALGGRNLGIAFTVVFSFLGLMFWWSYFKLILTPPGFARDHVPKGPPIPSEPQRRTRRHRPPPPSAPYQGELGSDEENIGGPPYSEIPQRQRSRQVSQNSQTSKKDPEKVELPASPTSSRTRRPSTTSPAPKRSHSMRSERTMQEPQVGALDAVPPVTQVRARTFSDPKLSPLPPKDVPHTKPRRRESQRSGQSQRSNEGRQAPGSNSNAQTDDDLPPLETSRRPPLHPTLLPEYRYCRKEDLVKPMRAHHCSTCAKCVLMYDHHCPWIGQCVGAHNHKFFVIFLEWCTLWLLWILATLIGLIAKSSSDPSFNVDGQEIAIIALSGFFSFFTSSLLGGHIRLIWYNMSSVESLWVNGMRSREREILGDLAPMWDWRKRNQIRSEWDQEWGELNTEGNIWWLGSPRANWEYRMGKNPWGWFLPIGRSEGDGLTYPVNPRFSADGRWRRRKDWPSELR